MTAVSAEQLALLHHTLGVAPERRKPYRNHFVAGPGHHDQPDLEALESAGMMKRAHTPAFCDQDDVVFCCTDAGRAYALENLPPAPKRTKFDDYMSSESSLSFVEWLGFDPPEFERHDRHHSPFAFGRGIPSNWVRMRSSRAIGEFCPTQKAAKSSYKEALRQRRMVAA